MGIAPGVCTTGSREGAGVKTPYSTLVYLCVKCHRLIHDDETAAARDGWIVIGSSPVSRPFLSWRGWVLPRADGSLVLLDFGSGRAVDLRTLAPTMLRKRVPVRRKSKRRTRGFDKR